MALNRRQKYIVLGLFAVLCVAIASWQLLVIVVDVQKPPAISERRNSMQMIAGYNEIKPNATQNDVIATMGSQFTVNKCALDADPNCAHIWHYEADGQAWDFTFDMDGNLMAKRLGTSSE